MLSIARVRIEPVGAGSFQENLCAFNVGFNKWRGIKNASIYVRFSSKIDAHINFEVLGSMSWKVWRKVFAREERIHKLAVTDITPDEEISGFQVLSPGYRRVTVSIFNIGEIG